MSTLTMKYDEVMSTISGSDIEVLQTFKTIDERTVGYNENIPEGHV